jgi:site-specific DNA recombinase
VNAAVYCRKSTDQSEVTDDQKSVGRQVENARAFAAQRGWTVDDAHVYVDDAVSGAESDKLLAKQRLLEVIHSRRAPFQVLVMQSSDRLSRRDGAEAFVELKSIAKAGVEIWFYAKGERFTYGDFRSNVSGYLQAEFAAEYRRAVAEKTYEAMARKARAGHVTGGVVFGYDNIPIVDAGGRRSHVERRINEREADVVRQIFLQCAQGSGLTVIAKMLNSAGAPAPRPRSRVRRPVGWAPSSVREILHRPLYRGEIVWNASKKRNVDGERQWQERAEAEWIRVTAPQLRIVSEELWTAAHARLRRVRETYLRSTNGKLWGKPLNPIDARYLLTGLAECGCCGGSLEVRSRQHGSTRGRRRVHFYACSTHRRRGAAVCKGLDVPMQRADAAVLGLLEAQLLDPGVLHDAIAEVLDPAPAPVPSIDRRAELLQLQAELQAAIGRLTDALADGGDSRALVAALRTREAALERVERDLARVAKAAPALSPERVRRALDGLLVDWRATLRREPVIARQMIAKLLQGRVVFTPEERNEQPGYRVRGQGDITPLLNAVLKSDGNGAQAMASPGGLDEGRRPTKVASPTGCENGRQLETNWEPDNFFSGAVAA